MTKPTNVSADAQSQAQSASGEDANKRRNAPERNEDEIQHFDTTVTKLVERENDETGETEWVECMSDNLYPGEKLKRADDEEKTAHKGELARAQAHDAAAKRRQAEDEILKNKRDADNKNK